MGANALYAKTAPIAMRLTRKYEAIHPRIISGMRKYRARSSANTLSIAHIAEKIIAGMTKYVNR